MRKQDFPVSRAREHLETGPIVLVSSAHKGERNVMTMGWHMIMGFEPSLFGCYIWSENHSAKLVRASKECVINVPTLDMVDTVVAIGNSRGEHRDKFADHDLTTSKATHVGAPLIDACYANFECRLYDAKMIRSYNLYIWEIVKAHVAVRPKNPRTIHYRGQGQFMVAGETISRRRNFRPDYL